MFSKKRTMASISSYSGQILRLRSELEAADAVIVGAGAGLSAAAGLTYDGERFKQYFSDFQEKYGIAGMYSGGFYPFPTKEEYWAWWSRHIMLNRYDAPAGKPYLDLLALVQGKAYFVITTNVDHQFQKAGIDKSKLFYTQGDYGLWQCARACHAKTYGNEQAVRAMVKRQSDCKVPTELLPRCPNCGAPMTMNLRCDDLFVQDEGWYAAKQRYEAFVRSNAGKRVLYLELGVGSNTPGIIKLPFWRMVLRNPNAVYACINLDGSMCVCPQEIEERALHINRDIGTVLNDTANTN